MQGNADALFYMHDGEALFVREFGQGEPVVVLSGLGMHSWQWFHFCINIKSSIVLLFQTGVVLGVQNLCAVPELDAIRAIGKI